jgi:hypothetical protein
LLVLSHHIDLILGIPVQGLEHDVVTARWESDLWFPLRGQLLGEISRKETRYQRALIKILMRLANRHNSGESKTTDVRIRCDVSSLQNPSCSGDCCLRPACTKIISEIPSQPTSWVLWRVPLISAIRGIRSWLRDPGPG